MTSNEYQWLRDMLIKLDERQDEQNETLTKLTVSVIEHVRRTNILEEEMKPVKAHVQTVNGAAKIGLALLGIVATFKSLL